MSIQARLIDEAAPDYSDAKFPEPRPFQLKAHDELRAGVKDGHRAQMLMAATGAGKTFLGLRIAHEALLRGRRALFVCDRRNLIDQTSAVADRYGLGAHGVIMANHWRVDPTMPLQIASVQTLARREWPSVDVAIIDEAHTQHSSWVEYVKGTSAICIGLSATPFSPGLGRIFSRLVNAATMAELTESGVLVPMRVISGTKANMQGAATAGGEWTEAAAGERGMAIIGDVVTEWQRFGEGRKTICFGATIQHCEELCKKFNEAGIMAAVFCADTPQEERVAHLAEFSKPESKLRVLISVEALSKGLDQPDVGCVIDVRPLRKSLSTAIQMWGRGLRSSPSTGKKDCILLDHSGNIIRFANDYSDIFYNGLQELDAGEKLDKAIRKDEDEEAKERKCPSCGFSPVGRRCIACGHEVFKLATVEHEAGVMREIFIGKTKLAEDRRHLYEQVCTYTRSHGNADTAKGRAAHLFREMTGSWPDGMRYELAKNVPITRAVMNQIKARNIRFVRGKQAGEARA